MKFCDKCKGIVVPDKTGKKMVCGSCGKIYKKEKLILKEDIKKTEKVEVVDSNVDVNPKVDIECPKCGHGKASFWSLQTRASDEGETRFYECTKCHNRWRDYT